MTVSCVLYITCLHSESRSLELAEAWAGECKWRVWRGQSDLALFLPAAQHAATTLFLPDIKQRRIDNSKICIHLLGPF